MIYTDTELSTACKEALEDAYEDIADILEQLEGTRFFQHTREVRRSLQNTLNEIDNVLWAKEQMSLRPFNMQDYAKKLVGIK